MNIITSNKVTEILERAKNSKQKGCMSEYERYKYLLRVEGLSPSEYESACRTLAKFLRV